MRRTLLAVTMASAFLSTLLCSGAPAQKRPPVRDSKSVYASASKAVVTILVMDREGQQIATGSGVVVSSNGRIVTNYHLVAGGTFFEVRFASATGIADPAPARPIACLPDRDLAMLGVTPDRRLAFAGQTASLPSVGERVLAIGSPLGLEGTLSEGVVSQLRELDGMPLIQTTAQISPGSSGGGLFLYTGDLAGITTMSLKGGQSLNFAVPVDAFRQLRDCKTFPPLPTPESDRALSPTPTPDSCAGLTRLGKALGKINSLNSKGQDEWIAALNRKSRNEPVPDANVYQLQVLAELRLVAADVDTGKYDDMRRVAGSLLLALQEYLHSYEAMISAFRAAHWSPSVAVLQAGQRAMMRTQAAEVAVGSAVVALNEETAASCPNWGDPVYEYLRKP